MKEIPVPPASLELDRALARSTDWAMRIAEAWQSSVANIVEIGRLLIQAADYPSRVEDHARGLV